MCARTRAPARRLRPEGGKPLHPNTGWARRTKVIFPRLTNRFPHTLRRRRPRLGAGPLQPPPPRSARAGSSRPFPGTDDGHLLSGDGLSSWSGRWRVAGGGPRLKLWRRSILNLET